MKDPAAKAYENLTRRLQKLRRDDLGVKVAFGLMLSGSVLLSLGALWVALEVSLYLSPTAKLTLGAALSLTSLACLVRFCLIPILRREPLEVIALRVEGRFPQLGQRLIGTLQLWPKRTVNPEGYSLDMIDGMILQADELVGDLDLGGVVDRRSALLAGKALSGLIILSAALALLFPSQMGDALGRWAHPLTRFVRPPETTVLVDPGDAEVLKGEDLDITIRLVGKVPEKARILSKELSDRRWDEANLLTAGRDSLSYTFQDVKRSLDYFVRAGDGETQKFRLNVIDRPMVRKLWVKYEYPSYTQLAAKVSEGGDISAIVGTKASLEILANKPLKEAKLVFEDELEVEGEVEGRSVRVDLEVVKDGRYHIRLVDLGGAKNAEPIEYRIQAEEDEFPTVRIAYPGKDTDLADDMLLPLSIEARDDFGFSRIDLVYKLNEEGARRETISPLPRPGGEIKEEHLWDLSQLNLLPEDQVSYHVEAFDNDSVSGPKKGESSRFVVRFPSLYEIYQEAERSQEEQIAGMERMIEEGRQIKEELDELRRELLRREELEWEERKNLEVALEKQTRMAQEMKKLAERMGETIDKLEKSGLVTLETLRKLEQIRQLMDEMATPELRRAMEKLKEALSKLDPKEIQQAMKDFSLSQEDFQKRLDRTISILKRLQIEQRMDAAVKKAEELSGRQGQIVQRTEEEPEGGKLSEEERALSRDTERLKGELEELAEMMEGAPADEVSSLAERIAQGRLPGRMEEMAGMLASGRMFQARSAGESILGDLERLSSGLKKAREALLKTQQEEISKEMAEAMKNLLYLSEQEEGMASASRSMGRESPNYQDLAERQASLLSGASRVADRLLETAQKTFFITPAIGQAMGRSLQKMAEAASGLEQSNGPLASLHQREAMVSLNQTAALLRQAMSALSSSQSSVGLSEMMERLGGLAERQMGINRETEGMLGGRLSMQQRAAMARLAAEQEALRKGVEELARELGGRSEILGRLDKMGEEMEKVIQDLKRRDVDQRTIDRQRKILSRLLDAQRSIHRRDYSRKRESKPGEEYIYQGPRWLEDLGEGEDPFRESMLKALKEGYSKEYKELIRRYFEAISRDLEGRKMGR